MYTNALDLDAILAKTNETYGHTPLRSPSGQEFVLRNALQLSKEERESVAGLNDMWADEDEEGTDKPKFDQAEHIKNVLRLVTDNKDALEELLGAIGDNLAALATVFRLYNEGTQAGEA